MDLKFGKRVFKLFKSKSFRFSGEPFTMEIYFTYILGASQAVAAVPDQRDPLLQDPRAQLSPFEQNLGCLGQTSPQLLGPLLSSVVVERGHECLKFWKVD